MLGAIPNACTLFEPLHLTQVPEAKDAGFSWRTFASRDQEWTEGESYLRRVFEGRVINSWTAREISLRQAWCAKTLIVKFVRATRLLPWICHKFDIRPPILLIRHPCAVVASQLNYGWKEFAKRPESTPYLQAYPRYKISLDKTEECEEHLAASWALDYLPALMEQPPHPWILITYEELLLYPEKTLATIQDRWGLQFGMDEALSRLMKPSSTVSHSGISGISGWRKTLSRTQISRVLNTVQSLGISFYADSEEANYEELYRSDLASRIQHFGMD